MITFLSLSLTLTMVLSAAPPPTIKKTAPSEILRLDDCIQIRFLDRKAFGMSRIAAPAMTRSVSQHGLRTFQPENPTEQAVVDQLRQARLEVAVYLVGRQALGSPANTTGRAGLQGPASITLSRDAQLPDEAAIFNDGKIALATIGQSDGYDTKTADWTVALRPLRASSETCIQCHATGASAPKLGDALGIVMYVYRPRVTIRAGTRSPYQSPRP